MQTSGTPRRFTQSLLGRMTLMGIVPAAMVVAAIVAMNAYRKYELLLDNARDELKLQSEGLATWVEAANGRAIEVAKMLATAQVGGLFGKRAESTAVSRQILEASPEITGTCIAYEPNADGQDATLIPKGGTTDAGRFVPYWFRDWTKGDQIGFKPTSGMDVDLWYVGPRDAWLKRKSIEKLITEPYSYEGQLMVETTWPIIIDGQFKGVCTADRALSTLQREVSSRADAQGVDVFLLTARGHVVVATEGSRRTYALDPEQWKTKRIEDTPHAALFKQILDRGESQKDYVVEAMDNAAGGDAFFAVSRVPTGDWTLVMSVPRSQVTDPIMRDTMTTAGMALVGLGLIVGLIAMPTRQLVRRVDEAAKAAQQVAAGDLTREASNTDSPDETGDLLRALDSMTGDLNALVGQVRGASVQLTTTATELSSTARQQEEVVATFGASSTQIAAAVREITTTGQELAREMEHVDEVATATARLAQDGRSQLEVMEGAMQSLDQATAGVADRLAAINEKAVNIGGVVTTITKVAEQTNLLSVNAAIEAEKAGEYGRGFLVVAREIRRLADQTAQATLDIERMVKEMQGAVSSGVMEMDRFSDQVRRNVGDVRGIGRSMSEIIGRVDESTRSFGTVRQGMQSQAAGAAQISDAMGTLSTGAKGSADAVREFGRAAEDLQKAIGTLRTAIAAFHLRT
jgi:methyl-accepting chemotaxis protein